MEDTKLNKAIDRNLAELHNAILKRRALIGMHSAKSAHSLDFFTIVADALFNDIVAHTILVLDSSAQSASFWYVHRAERARIEKYAAARSVNLDALVDLARRFKHIRDKTHFHIDRAAVLKPSVVWSEAAVTGDQLGWTLETTYQLLADLKADLTGTRPMLPEYDGSDAAEIIRAYKKQFPNAKLVV